MLKLTNAERAILKELWALIQSGRTSQLAQDNDAPPQLPTLPLDAPPDDGNPPNTLDDIRRN